jgi:hypothetical protein
MTAFSHGVLVEEPGQPQKADLPKVDPRRAAGLEGIARSGAVIIRAFWDVRAEFSRRISAVGQMPKKHKGSTTLPGALPPRLPSK